MLRAALELLAASPARRPFLTEPPTQIVLGHHNPNREDDGPENEGLLEPFLHGDLPEKKDQAEDDEGREGPPDRREESQPFERREEREPERALEHPGAPGFDDNPHGADPDGSEDEDRY